MALTVFLLQLPWIFLMIWNSRFKENTTTCFFDLWDRDNTHRKSDLIRLISQNGLFQTCYRESEPSLSHVLIHPFLVFVCETNTYTFSPLSNCLQLWPFVFVSCVIIIHLLYLFILLHMRILQILYNGKENLRNTSFNLRSYIF